MKPNPLAALAVLLIASFPARAADDLTAAIGKCAALTDDTVRLACYDKAAGRPTTVAAAPATKEQQESWFGIADWFSSDKASPSQQTTPQQFGSENLPPPPAAPGASPNEPLDHITATVSDFAYNPFGRFTVFLENGQIWQQLQADTDRANFDKHAKNQVTISRGLIGSYNLSIGDHAAIFKVKRIK